MVVDTGFNTGPTHTQNESKLALTEDISRRHRFSLVTSNVYKVYMKNKSGHFHSETEHEILYLLELFSLLLCKWHLTYVL